MEQEVRFCTSADGTRIAYSTDRKPGARALVLVKNFDRAQQFWRDHSGIFPLSKGLASNRRLVTFDHRGVGDSQRDVHNLAMPAQVDDLAAVVEQLGLESVDLIGQVNGAALATAYAVEYPERVGRFVLMRPWMRTTDSPLQGLQDMAQSIRANWSLAISRRNILSSA